MERRIYPRPPIVEAVIEFQFISVGTKEELLDALSDELGEIYSGKRRNVEKIELNAKFEGKSISTKSQKIPHLTFLQSGDGTRLVGCGDNTLSLHVLAPYPGWESFIEQTKEVIEVVPEFLKKQPIQVISVRYIDKIVLPLEEDLIFDEFLKIIPSCPSSLPPQLRGFHFSTDTFDPIDNTNALLRVMSVPPEKDGRPVVLYDLGIRRFGEQVCTLVNTDWIKIVEELHDKQRSVFEESITGKMRGLFQ